MTRPTKHPRTGIYHFRKAVPEALRALVGKREEKRSLGTKDPIEAKRLFAIMAANVEREWATLQKPVEPLSHKQIVALSGVVYQETVGRYEDNPERFMAWPGAFILLDETGAFQHEPGDGLDQIAAHLFGGVVDDLLLREEVCTDAVSRLRLCREVFVAAKRAAQRLKENLGGNYSPDANNARFPEWKRSASAPTLISTNEAARHSLTSILEGWWRESQAAGLSRKTYKSYSATMGRLIHFLGHDDAGRVSPEDIVRYKDHRLAEVNPRTQKPVSAKTVKDSDLAGLKAVFNWAVANRKMASNPAQNITIKLGKKLKVRSPAFSDEEARSILSYALNHRQAGRSTKMHMAKRWIPWLCAYTGARVGEMAQLRKQDIRQQDGYWVLTITPEAGTVKSKEARTVPLHTHLVEQGFPEFVGQASSGHLFFDNDKDGGWEKPAKTLANRLRDFVREVVKDADVQPNHGWRHRFKTLCREAQIDPRVTDEIQGHASGSVSDTYGDVTVRAMAAALERFPRQGE